MKIRIIQTVAAAVIAAALVIATAAVTSTPAAPVQAMQSVHTAAHSTVDAGFGISSDPTVVARGSIIVPEGYTQALVTVHVSVTAMNRGRPDGAFKPAMLEARALLSDRTGGGAREIVEAGTTGSVATTAVRLLTGLSAGDEIPFGAWVTSTTEWTTSEISDAYVGATAVFTP